MPRPEPPTATRERNAPLWIKLFVAFHLVAITAWALPMPNEAQLKGEVQPGGSEWLLYYNYTEVKQFGPIRAYLFATGFWQYWDMFSPNPAGIDVYCDAEIVHKDGTTSIYAYPRIHDLPIPEKYLKERWRKFYERVNNPNYCFFWPVFAQRLALFADQDPANPPVLVRLRRHTHPIPGPGQPDDGNYKEEMFFQYAVDQAKLESDRKAGL